MVQKAHAVSTERTGLVLDREVVFAFEAVTGYVQEVQIEHVLGVVEASAVPAELDDLVALAERGKRLCLEAEHSPHAQKQLADHQAVYEPGLAEVDLACREMGPY